MLIPPAIAQSQLWRCLVVLMAFTSVFARTAEAGDCSTNQPNIATDRPDVTNSSLVVPLGSLQSENGMDVVSRNGSRIVDGTNSRLRAGVAPCMELLVDLPTYFAAVHGPADSGFSNVAPALKWQISPVPGQFDLSATAGLGLPTGSRRIAGPVEEQGFRLPMQPVTRTVRSEHARSNCKDRSSEANINRFAPPVSRFRFAAGTAASPHRVRKIQ